MRHFVNAVRSPWLLGCLVVGLSMCCLICCCGGMLFCPCAGEPLPERNFKVANLLINVSAFPEGWMADSGPSIPASAPLGGVYDIERTLLSFGTSDGSCGASEEIYRFSSIKGAQQDFERRLDVNFTVGEYDTPWVVPEELSYQSFVADQFYYSCSTHGCTLYCQMLGRYEEYVVVFSTGISPDFMTYRDFEYLLQAIDETMAQVLDKSRFRVPTPR